MKLSLSMLLLFSCVISSSPPGFNVRSIGPSHRSEQAEPQLILETSISDERYEVEQGITMLRWNLTLTYKNTGTATVLLYKKSSLIYRSMISRSLKAASRAIYEEDTSSHFISVDSLRAAGFLDRLPEEADFVTLNPGEAYTVRAKCGVQRRNTNDGSALRPGQYFLEVRVATWYYWTDPKEYREKWRSNGYLWSQNLKSQPMLFSIQ